MARRESVLVTGGANGIGRAVCMEFARQGAQVLLVDKDRHNGPWVAERIRKAGGKADFLEADLENEASLLRMAARACQMLSRGLDTLINNAAISSGGGLAARPKREWDKVLAVNLTAPYLLAREFFPLMPPGSSIINISSTRALMSEPDSEPYSATKGGLLALTHSLALSLAPRKIRVNAILPGWIETSAFQGRNQKPAKLKPQDHAQHPAGRVGVPEDIAQACLFLADKDKAGFITGTRLVVDGGMTVKMIYD